MKRVLMLIHQFRPIGGGAELQAERLAGALVRLGHQVEIVTMLGDQRCAEHEVIDGVPVHRVRFPLPVAVVSRGWRRLFGYLAARRRRFDLLHSHMAYAQAAAAAVAARLFGLSSVLKVTCAGEFGDLHDFERRPGGRVGLRMLHQHDAVVAVSREVEAELRRRRFPMSRVHRIPNGVDTDRFRPAKRPTDRERARFVLIGRRAPQKGIDTALEAVRCLMSRGLAGRFELLLYGEPAPGVDYQQMAARLGVTSHVGFHGFTDSIQSVYDEADCFVSASRSEGLSNALLEAMSCELPVIATRVSGTVELVTDGSNGLLVPAEAPAALADAMETAIREPGNLRRMGVEARQTVVSGFSLARVARLYAELYESLAGGSR